jgi:hypothetical protein
MGGPAGDALISARLAAEPAAGDAFSVLGDGVIHGMLYFNGDIFDDASAERLLAAFKKGLRDGLAAPNGYLGTESRARDARGESIEAGSTVVDLLR